MNTQTSALFEQATDKLRDEMAANTKDGAIEVIGEFLTVLIRTDPECAEKIMAEKKTIKGAMEAMKAEAEKHKNGNWACLDFCSGIRVVLKYFGLPEMQDCRRCRTAGDAGLPEMQDCRILAMMNQAAGAIGAPEAKPEQRPDPTANADKSFDLDALLDELG